MTLYTLYMFIVAMKDRWWLHKYPWSPHQHPHSGRSWPGERTKKMMSDVKAGISAWVLVEIHSGACHAGMLLLSRWSLCELEVLVLRLAATWKAFPIVFPVMSIFLLFCGSWQEVTHLEPELYFGCKHTELCLVGNVPDVPAQSSGHSFTADSGTSWQ